MTRFVAFHDLPDEALENFKANLEFLKRRTNVVSLDEFFLGKLSLDKTNVVITFDDGFKNWVTNAIPVLKDLGLPAIFFVSSGFVGLSKESELKFIRSNLLVKKPLDNKIASGLSFDEVKKIVQDGFSIGGHTLTHCNLARISDRVQLQHEIVEDKIRLERMIGKKIEYFAYPTGAYQNQKINLTEILREAGYKGAVTTEFGFNNIESNPYLLHRELTSASMPEQVFKARVYGNYDAVRFLKEKKLLLRR